MNKHYSNEETVILPIFCRKSSAFFLMEKNPVPCAETAEAVLSRKISGGNALPFAMIARKTAAGFPVHDRKNEIPADLSLAAGNHFVNYKGKNRILNYKVILEMKDMSTDAAN